MEAAHTRGYFYDLASSVAQYLSRVLAHYFGHQVNTPILGPLTITDLVAAVIPLLCAVIVNVALTLAFQRQADKTPHQRNWRTYIFNGVRGPVYLILWLVAIYFAIVPLHLKLWAGPILIDAVNVLNDIFTVAMLACILWLCLRLTHFVEIQLDHWAERMPGHKAKFIVPLVGRSLRALLPILIVISTGPLLGVPQNLRPLFSYGSSILIICVVAWILLQTVSLAEKALLSQYDVQAADNLRARKVHTQAKLITRTLHVAIFICALASILMLFQQVRQVGTSMLASAGIVGVVAGIAAQRTLANLIAGFQIALAQPIRHDDVVVVENEWGRIEEITLTYVVVRIWDERRMVLPLTYFIEKPFQNWTRSTSTLLGSVFVWVDYTFPVDEARKALKEIIESQPLWDKRFWSLQVSDASDKTMQLRILATAASSPQAWDLRCAIREQFIGYIQKNYPQCLPRVRAELDGKCPPPDSSGIPVKN
jgi:small-conductance mechanosensitive channel